MISKMEQRATRALQNPMFAELKKLVPAADWDDPRQALVWLKLAAAEDPRGAQRPGYLEAHAALTELNSALDLQSRLAQLCADPHVLAATADRGLDFYIQHPEVAYRTLVELSATDPDFLGRGGIDRALQVVREAADWNAEHGVVERPVSEPIPTDGVKADTRYKELIRKSLDGPLPKNEEELMHQLATRRISQEQATEARAAMARNRPPAVDEYTRLIKTSADRPLSDIEQTRLTELATERAAAAGLLETEPADNGNSEGADNVE